MTTTNPMTDYQEQGGIRHNAANPCPSGKPYPHTYTAHCRPTGIESRRTRPHPATTTTTQTLEARAGVYRLGYDHLAMVVANFLATVDAFYTGHGTVDAYNQALTEIRKILARDIESYLNEKPEQPCHCSWLGIGTPEHPRNSLCLTPEQDHANQTRSATPDDLEHGGIFHTLPCKSGRPTPHRYNVTCRPGEPASSVPPVARGETTPATIAAADRCEAC